MPTTESTYEQIKRQTASSVPEWESHPLYKDIDACWLRQHLPQRTNDPAEYFAEHGLRQHLQEHPAMGDQVVVLTRYYLMEAGQQADMQVRIELRQGPDGSWRRNALSIEGYAPRDRMARVRLELALVTHSNLLGKTL